MGSDPDLAARMETVAHRVEFLELLDEEGPLAPRDVVDALEFSRGTVTRALRDLREADLVEKRSDGYAPTLAGVMAADEYRRYETASRAILSSGDLLAPIPEAHAPPVELLIGADAIRAEGAVPVRALEAVADRVNRADSVRAYLPTLVNTHLLRVWHRAVVAGGVEGEAVIDPALLTVLKGQYPHLLAEMAATDGFAAVEANGPPYGLVVTTTDDATTVAVVVYEGDTGVRGVLTNDSPAAVEWARGELDRLGNEGSEVTADLDALSAAVADGMVRSPRPGSGPSHHTGDPLVDDADGHALPIDLEAEGFVRLSEEYFDAHGRAEPAVSWRTGFTIPEVQAGHALDRRDAEGRDLTRRLVGSLQDDADHVVLGPPGSGKSTVCMAVACEWYDRGLGPVLYRERGGGDRFDSAALLEAYLRQADGHALVVVEDTIRDEANAVFAVMQALDADESVTFLLDARTHEWRDPEVSDLDARRDAYRRTAVEETTVPDLDETECERFVAHFADLIGADVDLTGAELFETVEGGTAGTGDDGLPAGDALVAQHHLARRYDPPAAGDARPPTALDESARRAYRRLTDDGPELAADLGVLVAVFTAAGIPAAREYCYAVAADDEFAAVDEALSALEGRLLFERTRPRAGSPTTYRTRHETWAMRFLEQFRAIEPDRRSRERFGRCVTRLLALADDPGRRERIERHLGGRTPHLHRIEADPGGWADELAERIFGIGRTNGSLAPLFGETTDGTVALPAACSAWTHLQGAYWRGEMNRTRGDLARAEREFRTLGELAEDLDLPDEPSGAVPTPEFTRGSSDDVDVETHRKRWLATSRTNLGRIACDRGEYDAAEEHHRDALGLFREVGDPVGEAIALKNLGIVAFHRVDFELAREFAERSLDIAVEHDAKRVESASLNNIATAAQQQGDDDLAREYYERSLNIFREVGNRSGEGHSLNNLGTIARERGEYDRAREYHEESLDIFREIGNRPMEATNFTNLGTLARKRGEYDRAREYHEESLDIFREVGNRQAEGYSLNQLGTVARRRGDHDEAREYQEESLAVYRDLGNRSGIADALLELGAIARERGENDRARDHLDRALENYEESGDEEGIAEVRLERGRLSLARARVDVARERVREARETFEELDRTHDLARSRLVLGQVAAAAGALEEAREHWRAALETFESVGAPQDALAALAELVEACRERGDAEAAREWSRRARDVLGDAPETTAAQHREWIGHHAADFDDV